MTTVNTFRSITQMHRKLEKDQIKITEWWSYLQTLTEEEHAIAKQIVKNSIDAQYRLRDYKNSYRFVTRIRKYCNLVFPNDVYPYEVVKVISNKCVVVRAMDTVQTKFPTEYAVGGFVAHCADVENQAYQYISNPANSETRIHLAKKGWGNGGHQMSDTPRKFYDYNL